MRKRGLTPGRIPALFATVAALVVATGPAAASTGASASRYASIVIEAQTGEVLYERNADLPRYPASLTKMMTLYLAFEAIEAGKLSLSDAITVSAHAAGRDPSRLNVAPGSRLKVEDAIRAMTTKSANDAACAMAEALGEGNESRFATMMTAKARSLGMEHTTFRNGSGLPQAGHVSTARDLALLGQALVRDFPDEYHYFSTGSFEFHGTRYPNQNRFLRSYYGADGIKTGFINASGHNLAASAVRGGKRLIAVVLGGDSQAWTREHATRLLDVSYAKIDPSLVMVASNASGPRRRTSSSSPSEVGRARPVQAREEAPAATVVSTPAGAVTIPSSSDERRSVETSKLERVASTTPRQGANERARAQGDTHRESVGSTSIRPIESRQPKAVASPAGSRPSPAGRTPSARAPRATEERVAASTSGQRPTVEIAETAPSRPRPPAAEQRPATEEQVTGELLARADPETTKRPAREPRRREARRPAEPVDEPPPSVATPVAMAPEPALSPRHGGEWSVQVGLFRDATVARRRGEEARSRMPIELRGADLVVSRAGDGVHVTSRIGHLSEQSARAACSQLQRGRVPCVVVPPGRPLVVATN